MGCGISVSEVQGNIQIKKISNCTWKEDFGLIVNSSYKTHRQFCDVRRFPVEHGCSYNDCNAVKNFRDSSLQRGT